MNLLTELYDYLFNRMDIQDEIKNFRSAKMAKIKEMKTSQLKNFVANAKGEAVVQGIEKSKLM